MNAIEIIELIIKSKSLVEVFPDLNKWNAQYKTYATKIHPDICKDKNANDALAKLNQYKEEILIGKKHTDDGGIITYTLNTGTLIGDSGLIEISLKNYNLLMELKDKSSQHFKQYLPTSMVKVSKTELKFTLPKRGIPASSLTLLPQEHVNWILSRMLEFSAWLNQIGFIHCGLNPDSIYITPENHGMVCISFYHLTKINTNVKTISGRYSKFYPANLFDEKKATSNIDLHLAKRTAIYLMGDSSGSGVKLKKTHNNTILNFIFKQHNNPLECFREYRDLLNKNYDVKIFKPLNV